MAAVAVARVGVTLLSSDVRKAVLAAAGALFLGAVAIVFAIVALIKSVLGFAVSTPGMELLPAAGARPGPVATAIPADQLEVMQQVASESSCGMPWSVLAGVASVESSFGANLGPS